MRIIVCGSRDWTDKGAIQDAIDARVPTWLENDCVTIVTGGCRGADALAGDVARAWYMGHDVFSAAWDSEGKKAGPIRNAAMIAAGADLVLAFGSCRGTSDVVRRAKKAGIKVVEIPA
jgi:hypothetical protein